MKRLVVISDVHGFYDELIEALNDVNFNPESDILISLGDHLDRGPKPQQVIDYLMSLSNAILIRGNHESLMEDLIERNYPCKHDWSNGTMQSVIDLAPNASTMEAAFIGANEKIKPFFNKMVNYFETENYIFVHGWIPVKATDGLPVYYKRYKNGRLSFNPDWRYAHASEWENARWLNGIDMAQDGFIEPNKTIVCGHWHCSYGHHLKSIKTGKIISEFKDDACFDPFYDNGIIAIDACTAHTNKVNVLVLEDNFLDEKETEQ